MNNSWNTLANRLGRIPERWIVLSLFVVVDLAQTTNRFAVHSDSMWSLHVAMSVLREGDIDLDEYREQIESANFFGADSVNGHLHSFFPVGPSLAVLPLVAAVDVACRLLRIDVLPLLTGARSARAESHVAAAVVALTAAVLYRALRAAGFALGRALAAVLVFAFCTSVWSTASRALWQHGPSMLATSAALLFLFAAAANPRHVVPAGLALACAWVIRPTNIVPLVVLSIAVAITHRRHLLGYGLGIAVPVLLFFLLNYSTRQSLLPPYFKPDRIGAHASFLEALAGNLVSPARGLFVFSPILAVAVLGIVHAVRDRTARTWGVAFTAIVILHWLVISTFPHWWGGHSYGPRLFTDMMPYFAWFLAVAFTRFAAMPHGRARVAWLVSGLLSASSFAIHYRGANSYAVHAWNASPADVDVQPRRVWDWSDPQFLR